MIRRRASLDETLAELENGSLTGVASIVINTSLWRSVPPDGKNAYRARCTAQHVQLRADEGVPRHFVELLGTSDGQLSSEREV